MKIDLLYVSHNRLKFTEASFDALFEHTAWGLIDRLFIIDDDSTDGTLEWLLDKTNAMQRPAQRPTRFVNDRFGGPVAVMNYVLDESDAEVLAKIDNDVIVCPAWLEDMLEVLEREPQVDALGMEPGFAQPLGTPFSKRSVQPARWIGGVGLFRTRIFEQRRPEPNNRWFGWTRFQQDFCNCAWISPDLPMFLLDRMPIEPWRSLSDEYIRKGWQRRWPVYPMEMRSYWEWFTNQSSVETPSPISPESSMGMAEST